MFSAVDMQGDHTHVYTLYCLALFVYNVARVMCTLPV